VSRGDVFVIEDSEPEDSGSDDDVPVVSASLPSREAVINVNDEEEEGIADEESPNNTEEKKRELNASVAMDMQHPDDASSEEGKEDVDLYDFVFTLNEIVTHLTIFDTDNSLTDMSEACIDTIEGILKNLNKDYQKDLFTNSKRIYEDFRSSNKENEEQGLKFDIEKNL